MEKMKLETLEMSGFYAEKLGGVIPEVVTEIRDENGKLKKAVDFEKLKTLLTDSNEIVEPGEEHYEFTWVGKKEAMMEANKPIRKTLRPCVEESKDWNNTENLYIEGDNLEVLKLLQESYLNSIKMIYIDPPYNTGNDFIYNDDFKMTNEEYRDESGEVDEEGNRLFKNTDSNGRFHSDWCSMMYSRLMLARNLLTDDGVIFISIDDNEQENLKKLCNEIFGQENFIAQFVWERAYSPKNDAKFISNSHDYIVMVAKNITMCEIGRLPRTKEANARYKNRDNDPRGPWKSGDLTVKTYSATCDYPIELPSGRIINPPEGRCWRFSKESFFEKVSDNRIWFGENGDNVPSIKRFLSELKSEGMSPKSILFYNEVGHSQEGAQDVIKLFDNSAVFDGPKPIRLIERLIILANLNEKDIVLDFFSGSATTAHAVIKNNYELNKNNKFILVQVEESVNKKKKNLGYENICEIGKERIRRAGDKIKEENEGKEGIENLDIGFRVLKVDDSNMKDVYFNPEDYDQIRMGILESNIKEDRTELDLLFGCLIDWGLPLNKKYESKKVCDNEIHIYNEGDLIACFDERVTEDTVKEIAKMEPLRVVFRDSCFSTSADKINVEEIFKLLSPDTSVRVI